MLYCAPSQFITLIYSDSRLYTSQPSVLSVKNHKAQQQFKQTTPPLQVYGLSYSLCVELKTQENSRKYNHISLLIRLEDDNDIEAKYHFPCIRTLVS